MSMYLPDSLQPEENFEGEEIVWSGPFTRNIPVDPDAEALRQIWTPEGGIDPSKLPDIPFTKLIESMMSHKRDPGEPLRHMIKNAMYQLIEYTRSGKVHPTQQEFDSFLEATKQMGWSEDIINDAVPDLLPKLRAVISNQRS